LEGSAGCPVRFGGLPVAVGMTIANGEQLGNVGRENCVLCGGCNDSFRGLSHYS